MGGEWTECTVDDLKSSAPNALATGPFGSAIGSRFFADSGVPVIRGSNRSQEVGIRLIDEGLVFIDKEKAREFSRSVAQRRCLRQEPIAERDDLWKCRSRLRAHDPDD
jgi:type I restriction enzyme S subunit